MKNWPLAITLCTLPLSAIPATAAEQSSHLEKCTPSENWNYDGGTFGVKNICDEAVVIQFMSQKDQQVKSGELKPGQRFETQITQGQLGADWWIFTTCPPEHISSVSFEAKHLDDLKQSRYACVKQ